MDEWMEEEDALKRHSKDTTPHQSTSTVNTPLRRTERQIDR